MTNARYDVLIVGAGHGGAQAAIALRQRGFAGTIALVGDEPSLPYERPPLSKDYLAGARPAERLLIRPDAFWRERGIEVITGCRIEAVDAAGHRADAADGRRFAYGRLVWAAGGHPRRLGCAGHDLAGVHAIRTRDDVDRLRAELAEARRIVVIGGGYVGLEAAAVLTAPGRQVTVLEAQHRLLARVAGPVLADFYRDEHRARGVDVRLGADVACIEGDARATGVRLADGERIAADLVIVGIGIVPATAPLAAAGATTGDGVVVDALGRTSLPDVFAIGDCAHHPDRFAAGGTVRLESVQNANDMAQTVAKAITGVPEPYEAVPWFWSNQFDLKLQTVGLSAGHDGAVTRGDPATRSFSVIYLRGGVVVALDCVNATRDYVQGRALVLAGAAPDLARLADPAVPLKELAAEWREPQAAAIVPTS